MALERISELEARQLEATFLVRASDDYFRDITQLYFRATLAELEQFPHTRSVSVEQVRLAQRVYENQLETLLKRAPGVLPARDTPATAQHECQYAILALQAIIDMPDPYRSWQLTSASSYVAQ